MRMVVLADDSTGANASAGALAANFGKEIPVFDEIPPLKTFPIVLNTRSREDSSRRILVERWALALWEAGVRDFDKRVDTTLRGPGAEELRRLCQALPERPWIGVVAAYPRASRVTRSGRQYLEAHPLTERLDIETDHLGEYLFGRETSCRVVTTDELAKPDLGHKLVQVTDPVIFDAERETDLIQIAHVLKQVRRYQSGGIVTVTSGALLRYYPLDNPLRTVIIMGSPTATNVSQINFLAKRHPASVWALEEPHVTAHLKQQLIVLHSGLQPLTQHERLDLSEHLVTLALERLEELAKTGWSPQRFILTGGELSQAFLSRSAAHGTRIRRLAAPLVGHGWIEGGLFGGCEVLTKGGMVGQPPLLLELVLAPALNRPQYSQEEGYHDPITSTTHSRRY